ncbi:MULTISPECIES: hypothetical protein [unclassified Streptomyces]|jgi:hypothetical protein|uniref:hypothetical protein n=1 Tax=unclassified Streptomyces TaxID=2593676 RepID=UPI0034554FF2
MNVAEEVLRFAELAARTGLEPALAGRFEADPEAVLREFGLSAGEAQHVTGGTPALLSLSGASADISDATWCYCWSPAGQGE